MKARTARFVTPIVLILCWLLAGGIGGPFFGKVSEVARNDQASFLPTNAEATIVGQRYRDFVGNVQIPAIAVFTGENPLTEVQTRAIMTLGQDLGTMEGVAAVSPPITSEDSMAAQVFIGVDATANVSKTVKSIRDAIAAHDLAGVEFHVTGPAGFTSDLSRAFSGIDGLLLLVTLSLVLVILVIVYRAVLLPFMVLLTSVFALAVALLTNWWLAKWGVLTITGQTQGILFILVIGAATDYSLLYTARYLEELRRHESRTEATRAALRGVLEPILASGGTVIAGLLCLLFSDLGSNRSLGPVAAIGVAFAVLASLTLLPSLTHLLGRASYWPRMPRFDPDRTDEEQTHTGVYARTGRFVSKRPRAVWIACVILLGIGAAFVPTLKADGVPISSFVLGSSDARTGQEELAHHFPGGAGSPAYVLTAENTLQSVVNQLLDNDGVASVSVVSKSSPSGSAPVTRAGIQSVGRPGTPPPAPTVDNGEVMLLATLTATADSDEAIDIVRELRTELSGAARIGGATATDLDTRTTTEHDRALIIPLVLTVILVILVLLLRSLLTPVLLVATTALSFGTAMGVAAVVFNHILNLPGADPSVPLYGFVFLVALGIDYNIFLMTRVREEALANGTREGMLRGLAVTGGVITSAGLVLAATFAALAVLPILFLLQIAFIVSFGVLLDTFVVRTLLVPALVQDIGPTVWWPSRLLKNRP